MVAVSPLRFQSNIFIDKLDGDSDATDTSPFLDVKDETEKPARIRYMLE
jgi:hypothetical protein